MKKCLAVLLCFVTLFSQLSVVSQAIDTESYLSSLPKNTEDDISVESFSSDVSEMIDKFDDLESENGTDESHRLIVKSTADEINELDALDYVKGYNDLHILQFKDEKSKSDALLYYQSLETVEYVQEDSVLEAAEFETENSVVYESAVSYPTSVPSYKFGYFNAKNNMSTENEVVVAVVDSGVQHDHEFLVGRVEPTGFNSIDENANCYDDRGHGTQVAGIIAANTKDNVIIKPYKVLNKWGKGTETQVSLGVYAAIEDGVDIINLSLSMQGESTILAEACQAAYDAGIIVVVAAGNAGLDIKQNFYSPGSFETVLSIAACTDAKRIADFSNYGSVCDYSAPGVDILSSYLDNSYKISSGTSVASPFICAAISYLLAGNPNMTYEDVDAALWANSVACYGTKTTHYVRPSTVSAVSGTAATPIFSTADCMFIGEVDFTIECATAGAEVLYKINNADPVFKQYGTSITISETSSITAYAVKNGMNPSASATLNLTKVDLNGDDFVVDENGVLVEYLGSATEITIPTYINGVKVISIAENSFKNNANITSVVLDPNITSIGTSAFEGCTSLTNFAGDGVTEMGDFCFYNCTSLQSVSMDKISNIPTAAFKNAGSDIDTLSFNAPLITTIENEAFYGSKIGVLSLSKLTSVGDYAFANCEKFDLTAQNLSAIGVSSFENCTSLMSAQFSKIATLPDNCFKGCAYLQNTDLSGATSIGENSFFGCSSMKNISFANLKTIGEGAFDGCESVTTIYLPLIQFDLSDTKSSLDVFDSCSSVTSVTVKFMSTKNLGVLFPDITYFSASAAGGVPDYAFQGCSKLSTIDIPNVQKAGAYAFAGTAIKSVNYSKLATIGDYCFSDIETLKTVTLPALTEITSDNYNMFKGSDNITSMILSKLTSAYYLFNLQGKSDMTKFSAAELTKIPNKMFKDCTSLTTLSTPKVTNVGAYAFENCGLTTLTLAQADTITPKAFANNPNFTKIMLGNVPSVDLNDFSGSEENITYLSVSNGSIDKNLKNGEKGFSRFPKLETVYYGGITIDEGTFSDCEKLTALYINKATSLSNNSINNCPSLTTFRSATLVNINASALLNTNNISIINLPAVTDFTQIAMAFNMSKIKEVYANGLTSITIGAFKNRTALEYVEMRALTVVPENAFYGCTNLNKVDCRGVETIGDYAFYDCTSLSSIYPAYMNKLASIGNYAFANNTSLSGLTLNNSLTTCKTIGAYAFKNCTTVTSLGMKGVVTIGQGALEGCSALTTINLPATTSIGEGAFKDCVKLQTVTLPVITSIDNALVFEGCTALKTFTAENLVTIAEGMFKDCAKLITVTLTSIKTIPANCFNGCKLLKTLSMPEVKTIGDYAFKGCTSLLSLNIETLEKIGNNAFENCTALNTVGLGNNVSSVGDCAFKNCSSLSAVGSFNQIAFGKYVFEDCTNLSSALFEELTVIPEGMYKNCTNLTEIVEYDSLITEIGAYAFYGCESIYVDNFDWSIIEYLGKKAFENSTFSINAKVYDMKSLKKAENSAFDGMNITELKLETIEYLYDVPDNSFIAVGKTLKEIELASVSGVLICGHENSLIEDYCQTSGIPFAAFGSDNAVSQPLCEEYYERSTVIDFCPIAFNPSVFQWYGCNNPDRTDAEKLKGMTTKKLTPAISLSETNDEGKYRYYFCEYQSVENGVTYIYQSALVNNLYAYIQGTDDTFISHEKQVIYTDSLNNVGDYTGIFTTSESEHIKVEASYNSGICESYGTGSQVQLRNSAGETVKNYIIIVYGDVNYDGVVDVLDSLAMSSVVNGHSTFGELDSVAADITNDGNINADDYQQVVNKSVA